MFRKFLFITIATLFFGGLSYAKNKVGVEWIERGKSGIAYYQGRSCMAACPKAYQLAQAACRSYRKRAYVTKCSCPEEKKDNGQAIAPFYCK